MWHKYYYPSTPVPYRYRESELGLFLSFSLKNKKGGKAAFQSKFEKIEINLFIALCYCLCLDLGTHKSFFVSLFLTKCPRKNLNKFKKSKNEKQDLLSNTITHSHTKHTYKITFWLNNCYKKCKPEGEWGKKTQKKTEEKSLKLGRKGRCRRTETLLQSGISKWHLPTKKCQEQTLKKEITKKC